MDEELTVPKPFNIYNPSLHMDAISASLPYLLYEAQIEGAKRQERADDFVRRYPYGLDIQPLKVSPRKPISRLIPGWLGW